MISDWRMRVASAPKWGGGHMARCLVLALEMRARAPDVRIEFLLDEETDDWPRQLALHGFAVSDTETLPQEFGLVFDHPDVVEAAAVSGRATVVMAINDDGPDLPDADVILHPHPGRENDAIAGVPALCGADYALIDPAWSALNGVAPDAPVSSVLIAFGMVDSVDATTAVLTALLELPERPEQIVIAVGAAAPHRHAIEKLAATNVGCRVIAGCSDLKPLAAQAHVIIGAGGVSLMERLAAGRVNMAVAQNAVQHRLIRSIAGRNAVIAAGSMPDFDSSDFIAQYQALCASPESRRRLAEAGRRLVDGKGAMRVASHLITMSACPG